MLEANRLLCSFDIESAIDRNIQTVAPDTPLIEAIALIRQGKSPDGTEYQFKHPTESFSQAPSPELCFFVVDETQAIGFLTPLDIIDFLRTGKSLEQTTVATVMQQPLAVIKESECHDISIIIKWFNEGVGYLAIIRDLDNQIVGFLTPSRLMQKFNFALLSSFMDDSIQFKESEPSVQLIPESNPPKHLKFIPEKLLKPHIMRRKKSRAIHVNGLTKIVFYKIQETGRIEKKVIPAPDLNIQLLSNPLIEELNDIGIWLNSVNFDEISSKDEETWLPVLAGIPDIILIIDESKNKITVAPTFPALLRSKEQIQIISQTSEKIFSGPQSETFLQKIHQSLKTQKTIQFDYTLNLGTHHKHFTASISPLPSHSQSVIWVARDMTEQKQMAQALHHSQALLNGVLNSSLDGIMAFQAIRNAQETIIDFQWLSINPAAEKIFGRPQEELLGKYLLQEMPGNLESGLFERYVEVVNTNQSLELELYYDHEGIQGWFKMIAVKLGDGFTATFRNITEDKESEETLKQANEKLIRWVEELKQRNREMVLLGEMNELLQACETVEEAYKAIGLKLPQLFPACSGGLGVIDSFKNRVETVANWGQLPGSKPWFAAHECWALRRGRSHRVDNSPLNLICDHLHPHFFPIESLCIPMMAQGKISGLLYLISAHKGRLNEAKQQLARTVSEQIALALANIKLRETLHAQSIRDSLTGLFNRRYLEETLERELQRACRQDQSVGVVMIDIDHFKHFNDTFGHDAGDAVLRQVGKLLMTNIRGSDIACRYGGEELTLILPDATLSDTYHRAEQIREAIKTLTLEHRGELLGVITASLGIACFPSAGLTGEDLIRAADTALYRAKALGRDRVITAGSYAT